MDSLDHISENTVYFILIPYTIDLVVTFCIQVFPAISSIKKDKTVEFEDGQNGQFDVIIFATGYNSTVLKWLKVHHNICFS